MNDGGPAFPPLVPQGSYASENAFIQTMKAHAGMSLRDWFAGQALCGLHASWHENATFAATAEDCYGYADAMLAERQKERPA